MMFTLGEKIFKASFDRKPHAAGHEFSFRTTKYPAVVAGLKNSTRPLVFTSVSGCRASEYFDISTEN